MDGLEPHRTAPTLEAISTTPRPSQPTGERRMNRPAFLTVTAAAGALSLGLLAVHFGSIAPRAATQATQVAAAPDLLASPRAADVVDAGEAFLATLTEEQRATAQVELTPRLAA